MITNREQEKRNFKSSKVKIIKNALYFSRWRAGSNVNKNGDRLYIWAAAMKACPTGWHLPSVEEWDILINQFGGQRMAGLALKSTSGWKDGGNGTNSSGFNVVPAGDRSSNSTFKYVGEYGYFWSSTEEDDDTHGAVLWAIIIQECSATVAVRRVDFPVVASGITKLKMILDI